MNLTVEQISLAVAVIATISSAIVAVISVILSNRNNSILLKRELKQQHYIGYIQALSEMTQQKNNNENLKNFASFRNKLLVVASNKAIKHMLKYEEAIRQYEKSTSDQERYIATKNQAKCLTNFVKAARKDLRIVEISFPEIELLSVGS